MTAVTSDLCPLPLQKWKDLEMRKQAAKEKKEEQEDDKLLAAIKVGPLQDPLPQRLGPFQEVPARHAPDFFHV